MQEILGNISFIEENPRHLLPSTYLSQWFQTKFCHVLDNISLMTFDVTYIEPSTFAKISTLGYRNKMNESIHQQMHEVYFLFN